jgi:hypothetical protein
LENQAVWLLDPIRTGVVGRLPTNASFELHMPLDALQGLRREELAGAQKALVEWIVATAPVTPAARHAEYLRSIRPTQPAGVPFEVTLHRFGTPFPPDFFLIKHLVTEVDSRRETRIREACKKKFPKLEAWRSDHAARTILAFEDNDIQLTNPEQVFEALQLAERAMSNRPDEVYLVGTFVANPWFVWALRVGERGYYDLSEARECMTEVDSGTLTNLTGR